MRSTVVVHEPEAFDDWLKSNTPATLASASGGISTKSIS